MKKILFLLMAFVCLGLNAQDKPLSFSEVIQVEDKTQAEIFGGLREWVATFYHDGKTVTQMEDPTTGTIILKCAFPFNKGGMYKAYEGFVNYNLKLQAKDGRFRVEMSNIFHENLPGHAKDCALGLITTAEKSGKGGINKAGHNKIWKEIKEQTPLEFESIATSLKNINSFNAEMEEDW